MDKKVEILLNSYKNIESVNTDLYEKIELSNNPNRITEYDIRNVLSVTEVFNAEREANQVYRIYGKIEYMSILNGLIKDYLLLPNFFNPDYTSNSLNILNSFNFYLVRPAVSGYTNIVSGGSTIMWMRCFQVVATPSQFELFPAGFGNNVFGEQSYAFNFNVDIDVSYLQDQFGFPVTELFLYAEYIKNPLKETLKATIWNNVGVKSKINVNTTVFEIGDYIMIDSNNKTCDIIEYSKSLYLQENHTPQTFYISTKYTTPASTTKYLQWKYNPFIPIRLRFLTDSLYKANSGGTLYDQVNSIPYYATQVDNNGNFVWRNIMPEGYTDPLSGKGTNYPFVNKRRYLFTSIVFDVTPDLDDTNTRDVFAEIWFSRYQQTLYTQPIGDINNIGKPCQ